MENQELYHSLMKIINSEPWKEKINILEEKISNIENILFSCEWNKEWEKEYSASNMVRYRFEVYREIFELFNDEKLIAMEGYNFLMNEIKKIVKDEDIQIINSSYGHDKVNTIEEKMKVERKHYIDFEQKVDEVLTRIKPSEQSEIKSPYDYDQEK